MSMPVNVAITIDTWKEKIFKEEFTKANIVYEFTRGQELSVFNVPVGKEKLRALSNLVKRINKRAQEEGPPASE